MFAESFFEKDNFSSRRTTGNNMFDPESLLTEGESRQGFDYDNSQRDWPSQAVYEAACNGDIPADLVPTIAPRVFTSRGYGNEHVSIPFADALFAFEQQAKQRSERGETPQQEIDRIRAELRNGQKNPRRLLCM